MDNLLRFDSLALALILVEEQWVASSGAVQRDWSAAAPPDASTAAHDASAAAPDASAVPPDASTAPDASTVSDAST